MKPGFFFAWIALAAGVASGQEAPAFEVASVKPSGPLDPAKILSGEIPIGQRVDGARLDWRLASLTDIVCAAYNVGALQLKGPDWLTQQRFDIVAKLPAGAKKDQVPAMLQALLADRFKLAAHSEHKDGDTLALVVAKGGPKLKESEPDLAVSGEGNRGVIINGPDGPARFEVARGGPGDGPGGGRNGGMRQSFANGMLHVESSKVKMSGLAGTLAFVLGRPVTDETGLTGDYQVALDLSMTDLVSIARALGVNVGGANADAASDPGGNSIFASVQALGLKLESRKGSMDLVVIDHIEKIPTDN